MTDNKVQWGMIKIWWGKEILEFKTHNEVFDDLLSALHSQDNWFELLHFNSDSTDGHNEMIRLKDVKRVAFEVVS